MAPLNKYILFAGLKKSAGWLGPNEQQTSLLSGRIKKKIKVRHRDSISRTKIQQKPPEVLVIFFRFLNLISGVEGLGIVGFFLTRTSHTISNARSLLPSVPNYDWDESR